MTEPESATSPPAHGIESLDFSLILASSVHDMKNSVGMLLSSLERVVDELPADSAEDRQLAAQLQYEASRINAELVQLLSVYRLQHDVLPVRIDQHFVIDVLEEQIARSETMLQSMGLEVEVVCDDELSWYFDAELIGGLVHNVLVNAGRYAKSHIRITAEMKNNELMLRIADDGAGYPSFMLDNHLASLEQTVDFKQGNTRLGLYFASCIASLHHSKGRKGRIVLSNGDELSGGSFTVYLP